MYLIIWVELSRMEYEVYRHNSASDQEFERIVEFCRQVIKEDKDLRNAAQRNISGGIFINGQLHPEKEKVCREFATSWRGLFATYAYRNPMVHI